MKVKIINATDPDGEIVLTRVFKAATSSKKIIKLLIEDTFDGVFDSYPGGCPTSFEDLGEGTELTFEVVNAKIEG